MKQKHLLKQLFFIVLSLCIYQVNAQDWYQLGHDIDGEAADDRLGISVCLSDDGTIMAVGAYRNDGNGSDAGHVRVYENQSGSWVQIGNDIDGEAAGDRFGVSVSLNANGTILAVGAYENDGTGSNAGHVRVFENQSGSWVQLGSDIDGEATDDRSGYSVSLSNDGTILAIGAYLNSGNGMFAGHVRVYEYQAGSWSQIGSDIDGEAAGDKFGTSVSLNSDGSIVAVGGNFNEGTATNAGHVRVFEYQVDNWVQIGNDIDGEAEDDFSGCAVSINDDGTILAVGAYDNDGTASNAGHVRVFEYQVDDWVQLGSDIDGEAEDDNSGIAVNLSSDGSKVAIGAYNNDGNGSNAGHVRVYEYQTDSWVQLGSDIDGEAAGDRMGISVFFNADATALAVGAYRNDGNGGDAGQARFYEFFSVPTITNQPSNLNDVCPGDNISFSVSGENIISYQWQVNEGSGFTDISDGGVYQNAQTETLLINGALAIMDGYEYQCIVSNPADDVTSNSASLTIESEDPDINSIHENQTLTADDNCEAELPDYTSDVTAVDNCDTDLEINQLPEAGTIISGTSNLVTITVTDDAGNSADVQFNVSVEDTENPSIECVEDQTIQLNQGEILYVVQGTEFDPISTDDNCSIASILNDYNSTNSLAGEQFGVGTTPIIWTVTDNSGNTNTCSFDIIVNAYVDLELIDSYNTYTVPNPTDGILTVITADSQNKIVLFDNTAKQLFTINVKGKNSQLDISHLKNGIYYVKIHTNNSIITKKIIKQ